MTLATLLLHLPAAHSPAQDRQELLWIQKTSSCCAEQQPISASRTGHSNEPSFFRLMGHNTVHRTRSPSILSLICLRWGRDPLTTIICPQHFALILNFHPNIWLSGGKSFLPSGGQCLLTALPSKGSLGLRSGEKVSYVSIDKAEAQETRASNGFSLLE